MTTKDRLSTVMPALLEALHRAAREQDLTNDELMAVVAFLTEVGRADEFVLLSDVLGVSRIVDDQTHASASGTPSNVLGPFYRPGAPWIENPGSIVDPTDDSARITLGGRVSDANTGQPAAGAIVDIWQANGEGLYSNEDGQLPPWNLRGRQRVDGDGRYWVETIRPSHYTVKDNGPVGRLLAALERHPWRPAHIHLQVSADGYRSLVTQAYIAGGPYLDDDTISGVKQELVVPLAHGQLIFDVALLPAGQPA
ncbi:MAG: dioxygenase [Chloroflexota bacterium]